jgi:hypothetical protein
MVIVIIASPFVPSFNRAMQKRFQFGQHGPERGISFATTRPPGIVSFTRLTPVLDIAGSPSDKPRNGDILHAGR